MGLGDRTSTTRYIGITLLCRVDLTIDCNCFYWYKWKFECQLSEWVADIRILFVII